MHFPDTNADPPPTLADRLSGLNDRLLSLAARLKEAIASTVGQAVSQAVRDLVRALLGEPERRRPDQDRWPDNCDHQRYAESSNGFDSEGQDWDENEDPWRPDSRLPPGSP